MYSCIVMYTICSIMPKATPKIIQFSLHLLYPHPPPPPTSKPFVPFLEIKITWFYNRGDKRGGG